MDTVETSSHPSDLATKLYASEPAPVAPVTETSSLAARMYGSTSPQSGSTMVESGAAPIASPKAVTQAVSTSSRGYAANQIQATADRLYASPSPDATPEPKPTDKAAKSTKPSATQSYLDRASKVYGEAEPNIEPQDFSQDAPAHRADKARVLFESTDTEINALVTDSAFARDEVKAALPEHLQSDEALAGLAKEARALVGDSLIPPTEIKPLLKIVGEFNDMQLNDTQRGDLHDQAIDALNREYGQGAKAALRDAIRWTHANPKIKAMLENGAGDHPQVVLAMVRAAQAARSRGFLK